MRTRTAIAVLLFATGLVMAEPQPGQAAAVEASSNGKVVFTKFNPATNSTDLFTIDPDGTDLAPLTRTTYFNEWGAAWSPDGKRVVFVRARAHKKAWESSAYHLAVLELAEKETYRITSRHPEPFEDPEWSPGSSYVAMSLYRELFYSGVWGGGGRTLTSADPPYAEEPGWRPEPNFDRAEGASWSPDGWDIAFDGKHENEPSDIFIIDREGENLRRIELEDYQVDPDWSPDGSRLLFIERRELWTMAPDGSDRRFVVSDAVDPHWSPDGTKIVFARDDGYDGRSDIYTIGSEGSDLTYLTEGRDPDWQPLPPGNCTLMGTDGRDFLFATPYDDVICLGDGDDKVVGRAGNDTIYASGGDDAVTGNAGNDLLHGGRGADQIRGGRGRDLILGKGGVDWLKGDRGNDEVRGNGDNDYLWGGYGRDFLRGGAGHDWCNSHHTDRRWSCERG